MTNDQNRAPAPLSFRASSFGFDWSFWFRHSNFTPVSSFGFHRARLTPPRLARLHVRRRVPLAQRLLDFVLNRARHLVPARDVPAGRDDDVEIHPVIPAAVAVSQLVVRADVRRAAGGAAVGIEDPTDE